MGSANVNIKPANASVCVDLSYNQLTYLTESFGKLTKDFYELIK